jgi:hypothetical protein
VTASWKLDTSTAMIASRPAPLTASINGSPMLPAATVWTPASASIAASNDVVVVFPFVPVTAANPQEATR